MSKVNCFIKDAEIKLLRKSKLAYTSPMLATLHKNPFSNKNWIYECKFDGIRALIYCESGRCQIMSRNQIDITQNYPELLKAFENLNIKTYILDGEIVAFKGNASSFSTLQQRMHINTAKLRNKKFPYFFMRLM